MIDVIRIEVGQMKANCYLVFDQINKKTLIIDPGDDADYIQGIISDNELIPVSIIVTHGHFDHVLAIFELKSAYEIPFFMNKNDLFILKKASKSANYFISLDPSPIPGVDKYIKENDKVKIGKYVFDVIDTPGHTPGGISIHNKKNNIVFVGDLIFKKGGIGRYDFSYSNKNNLYKSVKKILSLPNDTMIYSGHGEPTTAKEEKMLHII